MTGVKCFGILIEVEGGGWRAGRAIAGIARDRKGRAYPLIHTDKTDRN